MEFKDLEVGHYYQLMAPTHFLSNVVRYVISRTCLAGGMIVVKHSYFDADDMLWKDGVDWIRNPDFLTDLEEVPAPASLYPGAHPHPHPHPVLAKKCECGATKCGSSLHSSWCPEA